MYSKILAKRVPYHDMLINEIDAMNEKVQMVVLKHLNQEEMLIRLPGHVISADQQCALQYGKGWKQCTQEVAHVCTKQGYVDR